MSRRALALIAAFGLMVSFVSGVTVAPAAEEEGGGNNLSTPVIFAEGYGISGFAVDESDITSTGLPGLLKPPCSGVESWTGGSDTVAFPEASTGVYQLDINGTVYDEQAGQSTAPPGDYFLQPYTLAPLAGGTAESFGDENCWQASWADGSTMDMVDINALDVGDSLVRTLRSEGPNPIRVEFALYQTTETAGTFQDGVLLDGYPMTQLWPPGFSDGKPPSVGQGHRQEVWATADTGGSGTAVPAEAATVFTQNARLTIDRLNWASVPDNFADGNLDGYPSGVIPDTFADGYDEWVDSVEYDGLVGGAEGESGFSSEVNQGGRVLYGYNWGLGGGVDPGWYRVTLSLDAVANGTAANAAITGVNPGDQLADESEGGSDSSSKGFFPPTLVEDPVKGNYVFVDVYVTPSSPSGNGRMTGKVTNNLGGNVSGVNATVYDQTGTPVAMAVTGSDGFYEVGVPAGTYIVGFSDPLGVYLSEYHDDVRTAAEAEELTVPVSGAQLASAELIFFRDVQGGDSFAREILWLKQHRITNGCNPPIRDEFCPDRILTRAEAAALLARALDLPASNVDRFTDDDGLTLEPEINALAAAGITRGCSPTTFCPTRELTRAEMAAFLARALELPYVNTNTFVDDDHSTHHQDIERIAAVGITRGCSPTTFCPDQSVPREQAAAFLYRSDLVS